MERSQHDRGFRDIDGDLAFRPDNSGSAGDPRPSAERVTHLLQHARTCYEQQHYEASWNCMVHAPLLDLALCGCGHSVSLLNWHVTLFRHPAIGFRPCCLPFSPSLSNT